ncbi:hypothetical protein [Parasedimentitalea marina]|nr:hypothetical protein [Parasedimentitalea marina]
MDDLLGDLSDDTSSDDAGADDLDGLFADLDDDAAPALDDTDGLDDLLGT